MSKKKQRWWLVSGHVTVSAYTYVRASSVEEAEKKAVGREPVIAPYGPERSGANPTQNPIIEAADGLLVVDEVFEQDPDEEWLNDLDDDDDT